MSEPEFSNADYDQDFEEGAEWERLQDEENDRRSVGFLDGFPDNDMEE